MHLHAKVDILCHRRVVGYSYDEKLFGRINVATHLWRKNGASGRDLNHQVLSRHREERKKEER